MHRPRDDRLRRLYRGSADALEFAVELNDESAGA